VSSEIQRRSDLVRLIQPQDLAWTVFVALLLITSPERNNDALILVPLLGAFQIIEPRLRLFRSHRGQIASMAIKLVLCYFLIAFSDAIFSYYYPIFLIPIISAATTFELRGTLTVIALAAAGYGFFLLPRFVDWNTLPPGFISVVTSRMVFYAIVGFLVYLEARAKRQEMERTKVALERLTESNKNLRLAEASLRRSERLAALGQLTAGLAHELRNPLATIRASAEMISGSVSGARPEVLPEMAGYISSEVDRMNSLIARFLNFARPLSMKAGVQDLALVISEVLRQLSEGASGKGVKLVAEQPEEVLVFAFDPELMKVALTNLVQNAIQASESGTEVQIRIGADSDRVRILVTDHGVGIKADQLENIFNPFFTTKADGVGLGLALVAKIVDEHHGKITVFSEPGSGTTFEITLPKEQPS
jgi:signal transduction histidine kinase